MNEIKTDNGKKYLTHTRENNVLYKVKFQNGYCEFVNAKSSLEARNIIKSGARPDLENEQSLQSIIISVEEIKPFKIDNCESCAG